MRSARQRVFLLGFMGSGKTSTGRLLAERLEMAFVDLDGEVEERAGMTIPEIFRSEGEAGFRRRESEELRRTAEAEPQVVATGGGVVQDPANFPWMRRNGLTLSLDPEFETVLERLSPQERVQRPLFADEATARALFARRRPLYRSADRVLPITAEDDPTTVADRLAALVMESPCAT